MTEDKKTEPDADPYGSFDIIAAAGEARSDAFRALDAAKARDFGRADALLAASDENLRLAHAAQTELLAKEASGEHVPVDVMLVHAQDHLMTATLARELIAEIVELRREREDGGR